MGKKDRQLRAYENAPSSYKLDRQTYKLVQWTVREYNKYKAESQGIYKNKVYDTYNSNVEKEAICKTKNMHRLIAINKAFEEIPIEYREMIFEHTVNEIQYKHMDIAHEQTLKKYTNIFMFFAAYYLDEI